MKEKLVFKVQKKNIYKFFLKETYFKTLNYESIYNTHFEKS